MAKSKRSKHMRAMRRLLREKLSKKDEAKRLAAMKTDNLIPSTVTSKPSTASEGTTAGSDPSVPLEFNVRTMRNKEGQFPAWLSGRQRKRLQAKGAVQKKIEKRRKTKATAGRITKRKVQKKSNVSDKTEAMLT